MARRVHVEAVRVGRVRLSREQGHHVRDVLRLGVGSAVELFDDAGRVAAGVIGDVADDVVVDVERVDEQDAGGLRLTIAAAVPKGPRADWMVEKLSELGVDAYVPLVTARGVVVPEGKNKLERWRRIATEAAKQSRRRGVMRVGEVRTVDEVLGGERVGRDVWVCATEMPAVGVIDASQRLRGGSVGAGGELLVLVGPEGGWTEGEAEAFRGRGLTAVSLGGTILRVETAAVAVAAIVAAIRPSAGPQSSLQP